MSAREDGIKDARRKARALVQRFGVRAPEHICVEAFAERLGVDLVDAPLHGATAQLVRIGERAQIVLSDRETHAGARRFSIAHELAHLVLEHPSRSASELCRPGRGRSHSGDHLSDHEAEANAFAAELLMPDALLRARCEISPVTLDLPRSIAADFGVSLLASAIRFVELTSERCVAVLSERGAVRWAAPSKTFTRTIQRAKRLDPQSVAYDYFKHGAIDDRAQRVPADAWIDTSTTVEIVEHSSSIPGLGAVMSVLWVPEQAGARLRMT